MEVALQGRTIAASEGTLIQGYMTQVHHSHTAILQDPDAEETEAR